MQVLTMLQVLKTEEFWPNCEGWKCVSARPFWVPWKWHFRDEKHFSIKMCPKTYIPHLRIDVWPLLKPFPCVFTLQIVNIYRRRKNSIIWNYFSYLMIFCGFSNVSSNDFPERMHSHNSCIWSAFPQCVFSNVYSNCLHHKMHSYIGSICLTFLHCAFSNVPSNR